MGWKSRLHRIAESVTGLEVHRRQKPGSLSRRLLVEADDSFNRCYNDGLERTGTPSTEARLRTDKRKDRFYNLLQFLHQSLPLEGAIAECGCWKGLSSYLLLNELRKEDAGYRGASFSIIDSFEGLSAPTEHDALEDARIAGVVGRSAHQQGQFAASLDSVQDVLKEFSEVSFYKGWIPQVFDSLPEQRYRFVHVDVDLHAPTRDAVEYFFPRLVDGGLIVIDDYGCLSWPGAKAAVDGYCGRHGIKHIPLSTGQAVLWRPAQASTGKLGGEIMSASMS